MKLVGAIEYSSYRGSRQGRLWKKVLHCAIYRDGDGEELKVSHCWNAEGIHNVL